MPRARRRRRRASRAPRIARRRRARTCGSRRRAVGFDRSSTLCSTQAASSRRASSSDAGVTGMNRGSRPPTARGANQSPAASSRWAGPAASRTARPRPSTCRARAPRGRRRRGRPARRPRRTCQRPRGVVGTDLLPDVRTVPGEADRLVQGVADRGAQAGPELVDVGEQPAFGEVSRPSSVRAGRRGCACRHSAAATATSSGDCWAATRPGTAARTAGRRGPSRGCEPARARRGAAPAAIRGRRGTRGSARGPVLSRGRRAGR